MKISRTLLFLALVSGCAPAPRVQPAPGRFEADIQRFEQADRQQAPPQGAVVFTGSSSIRMWETLAADFPGTAVVNRGFGGSEMSEVVAYADRIVTPYRPRMVLVYAGDNDLSAGKTPARVLDDYRALVRRIWRTLPEARIGFISIKPSPSRWQLEAQMRDTNARIRAFTTTDPRLFYIDVFTPMLGPDGRPREELYLGDRLHMTRAGYEIWKSAIAPYL